MSRYYVVQVHCPHCPSRRKCRIPVYGPSSYDSCCGYWDFMISREPAKYMLLSEKAVLESSQFSGQDSPLVNSPSTNPSNGPEQLDMVDNSRKINPHDNLHERIKNLKSSMLAADAAPADTSSLLNILRLNRVVKM